MTDKKLLRLKTAIFGSALLLVILTFRLWAVEEPAGVLDEPLAGNHDLLYFGTDAPDTLVIYSPGLQATRAIIPASERMADVVVSPDGTKIWTSTKAGFADRFEIPVDYVTVRPTSEIRQKIAPVLSAIALSADQRFVAVGYGNSEDYNSRNIKILPADTLSLVDELADFAVSGDIQDIVANPVTNLFYIINSHSDRVRIYNSARFRLEPDIIELGNSPGNFVVRPDGKRAYGAMNARRAVAVVDLETNHTIQYVPMGFPPHAMCFNEDGSRLYVAARDSAAVKIINTHTNEIEGEFELIPRLPGLLEYNFPEMIGVSADERYMYVMPKRKELLIYDISRVREAGYSGEPPRMVQSHMLATEPFFMHVVRGHTVPGVRQPENR